MGQLIRGCTANTQEEKPVLMGLFLLLMAHFTENSLFGVLISPATKKEKTISFVNTGTDKDSVTRFNGIM